jgi:hypothetical protein
MRYTEIYSSVCGWLKNIVTKIPISSLSFLYNLLV